MAKIMRKPIGAYTLSNTISIFVYEIDNINDRVLARVNDGPAKWFRTNIDFDGFYLGTMYVPFSEVMRL